MPWHIVCVCVFSPGHSGVLDDQKVWGDDGSMPGIAYIDSQDVSRMMASAMIKDRDESGPLGFHARG